MQTTVVTSAAQARWLDSIDAPIGTREQGCGSGTKGNPAHEGSMEAGFTH